MTDDPGRKVEQLTTRLARQLLRAKGAAMSHDFIPGKPDGWPTDEPYEVMAVSRRELEMLREVRRIVLEDDQP